MSARVRDSWEEAIVRGRDGRKGYVTADHRPLLGGSTLVVHWEDDTTSPVDRMKVTMLKPPAGYTRVVEPFREERTGAWWSGIIGLVAALALAGWIVFALGFGR